MARTRRELLTTGLGLAGSVILGAAPALAASARQINRDAKRALNQLYASQPKARDLGNRAKAILVFPKIYKAGFVVGAQSGNGVLWINGKAAGYYNISAVSYGLQAGAQAFSYALFFMTDSALKYLETSAGWALGSGPSVVVVDKGAAASMTSTTLTQDVYAFPFSQTGLMAGLGLEGSKITHIHPGA